MPDAVADAAEEFRAAQTTSWSDSVASASRLYRAGERLLGRGKMTYRDWGELWTRHGFQQDRGMQVGDSLQLLRHVNATEVYGSPWREITKRSGSGGRIRTYDQAVNSRPLRRSS